MKPLRATRRSLFAGLAALAGGLLPVPAFAQEPVPEIVGRVERHAPQALILRGGREIPAELGAAVFLNDRIATGEAARLLVRFVDGTTITLGAHAELVIDRYLYDPGAKSHIALELLKGALRFVSGNIGTTRDKDVQIQHRAASLGVRGTDFWAGELDDTFSVLLLQGTVEVRTDVDAVVLNDPGEGVAVAARDQAPGPVKNWPDAKVQRALKMVAF